MSSLLQRYYAGAKRVFRVDARIVTRGEGKTEESVVDRGAGKAKAESSDRSERGRFG